MSDVAKCMQGMRSQHAWRLAQRMHHMRDQLGWVYLVVVPMRCSATAVAHCGTRWSVGMYLGVPLSQCDYAEQHHGDQ